MFLWFLLLSQVKTITEQIRGYLKVSSIINGDKVVHTGSFKNLNDVMQAVNLNVKVVSRNIISKKMVNKITKRKHNKI